MRTEAYQTEIYYNDADITFDLLNLFLFTLSIIITCVSWMDSAVWLRKASFVSMPAYLQTELKSTRFDFGIFVEKKERESAHTFCM